MSKIELKTNVKLQLSLRIKILLPCLSKRKAFVVTTKSVLFIETLFILHVYNVVFVFTEETTKKNSKSGEAYKREFF